MTAPPSVEWLTRAYAMANLQAEGHTYHEIAQRYGCSTQTVGWTLTRLRRHDPTIPLKRGTRQKQAPQWAARLANGESHAGIAARENVTLWVVYCAIHRWRRNHNAQLNQLRGVTS